MDLNIKRVTRILPVAIFGLPLLMLLSKSFYPENISKILLLVVCEISIVMIMYLTAVKVKISPQWLEKRFVFQVRICVLILMVLIAGLAYFTNRFTSMTESGEKVLLPLKCSGKLCELYKIAEQNGQEVADRYSKDGIVDIINACCKGEVFKSEIIYGLLMTVVYTTLSFLLILTNIFYRQKTFYETPYLGQPDSEYHVYVNAYLKRGNGVAGNNTGPNVFLSYTASDLSVAEQLYYSLKQNDCNVFFDRSTLNTGEEYNIAIYKAVKCSDVFIFLISNESIKLKKYTLTELKYASAQRKLRLLPVLVDETTVFKDIPAYAQSVSIFRTTGNLVAEVTVDVISNWKKINYSRLT